MSSAGHTTATIEFAVSHLNSERTDVLRSQWQRST